MASGLVKISVLLASTEARRFGTYCKQKGYKKSSLIARLVREHLDEEHSKIRSLSVHAIRPKITRKR
jgi:hypothetical protein